MTTKKIVFYLFAASLILFSQSCSKSKPSVLKLKNNWVIQSSALVKNNGSEISTNEFSTEQWYPTTVPTTILAALVENKVYPDPFYGENLKAIPGYRTGSWLSMTKDSPFRPSWWYKTKFEIPSNWAGKFMSLHLDGINLKANVWLNGHLIADTSSVVGMFLSLIHI